MKTRRLEPLTAGFDTEKLHKQIEVLIGKPVKITVIINGGKKRVEEGKITSAYTNLFLLETVKNGSIYKYSHTFIDVYTGRVTIEETDINQLI